MTDMSPSMQAAAFHGMAINEAYPLPERYRLARKALDLYEAEVERLRSTLDRWESGQRRKGLPVVESVPDGTTYAARLARAQGAEGGEEHDQLLAEAAQRLKALTDVSSNLLAEAVVLRAECERLRSIATAAEAWRDAEVEYTSCANDNHAAEVRLEVLADALIAAVDASRTDGGEPR